MAEQSISTVPRVGTGTEREMPPGGGIHKPADLELNVRAANALTALKELFEFRKSQSSYERLRDICGGSVAPNWSRPEGHLFSAPHVHALITSDRPLLNKLINGYLHEHDERFWAAQHSTDALVRVLVRQAVPGERFPASDVKASADPVAELRGILSRAAEEMRVDKTGHEATLRARCLFMRFNNADWDVDFKLSRQFSREAGAELAELAGRDKLSKKELERVSTLTNLAYGLGSSAADAAGGLMEVVRSCPEKQACAAVLALKELRGWPQAHAAELRTLHAVSTNAAVRSELAATLNTIGSAADEVQVASMMARQE